MRIKGESAAVVDRRLIPDWAIVTMGGRILQRFTILREKGSALQQSIDNETPRAVDAAVQASNNNQVEFSRFDIGISGLPAVKNQAA